MRRWVLHLTFWLCIFAPSTTYAEVSVSTRIELAGYQTALAHRLVRALCYAQADIHRDENLQLAVETRDEISTLLDAMIEGNEARGIAAETDSTTQTLLSSTQKIWTPTKKKVDAYLSGEPFTDKNLTKLSFKADSLQKSWASLISRYELKSTVVGGAHNLGVARHIAAANRQSSLIEQAGKLSCLVWLNGGPDKAKYQFDQLSQILPTFHLNTFGLAFSHTAIGLPPPPTFDIQTRNFESWLEWVSLSGMFDATLDGKVSPDELIAMAHGINMLTLTFTETMKLYLQL